MPQVPHQQTGKDHSTSLIGQLCGVKEVTPVKCLGPRLAQPAQVTPMSAVCFSIGAPPWHACLADIGGGVWTEEQSPLFACGISERSVQQWFRYGMSPNIPVPESPRNRAQIHIPRPRPRMTESKPLDKWATRDIQGTTEMFSN